MTAPLDIIDLGRRPYHEVLELQRTLRLRRIDRSLPHDMLLLVEHDPVYTLGRSTRESSLPADHSALQQLGADVVEIERGGDVTWHGPGQLVGYPIIDLTTHRPDLHWYLRTVEDALIDALGVFGLIGERSAGQTGVWVRGRKIASIGIHVKQWVTLHGFALNVSPDLGWFAPIVPCGIAGVEMTSVARELDGIRSDSELWLAVRDAVVTAFARAFDRLPTIVPARAIAEGGAAQGSPANPAEQVATLAIASPTGNS